MYFIDRNVVFLQPDDSSENQKNWVLLDSMYRSRDYNEFDILEQFKISKTQFHYHVSLFSPLFKFILN